MILANKYEMAFNSSGFCYAFDRYLFSDINRGEPVYNIFSVWRLLVKKEVSFIISGIILLFLILVCNNCCMCCLAWKSAPLIA